MSLSEISGSGSELSSRHIPDMHTLSSTSFSFQIPGTTTADNLLTDDDENDFFRNAEGADMTLALTHASLFSPVHTSPACVAQRKDMEDPILGIDELRSSTPRHITDPPILSPMDNLNHKPSNQRPKLSLNISPLIQSSPITSFPLPDQEPPISTLNDKTECNHPLLESKHPAVQLLDGPQTKTRLTKKRVEIKVKELQGQKKDLLRTQRKVVEGGIAKSRIATTKKTREVPSRAVDSSTLPFGSTQLSAPSLPERPVLNDHRSAVALQADSSSSSIFPMTGIAGRLIQYGHKYIDSFGGHIDDNAPTKKLTVNLDPTTEGPSITQRTTQERGEESSNISTFPVIGIADSLIQHRKKHTSTYLEKIGTNDLTEKVSPDLGLQPEPINQGGSIVQETTQERNDNDPEYDTEDDRSKPLTISQLSPRKQPIQDKAKSPTPITIPAPEISPPSVMRPATKRPVTTEFASEEPKLKKSKSDDEPKTTKRPTKPTLSKRILNPKPRVQSGSAQPHSRKPSTKLGSGSSSSLKKSDSCVTAAASKPAGIRRTKSRIDSSGKQSAVFKPGTGWNDNVQLSDEKDMQRSNSSQKLSGSGLQNSRIQNGSKQDQKGFIPSSSLKSTDGQGAPRSTEPIPEESDSRSTSRSHSNNSQSHKHKFYHPAPNFKVIHAAFDASLAQRKENIHPTVPLPIRWETDSRMQERKKFEERIREKEREKDKEEEERRRFREADEERELRELRKGMVVKAHEVPEWYNERPKTKRRQEQDAEN